MIASLKQGDPVPLPPEPSSEEWIMAKWREDPDKPLVSIVCQTYNHATFIKDALNGFLMQQTDFPFEIIVHDDASTDGTSDILREYQFRYPNLIRLIIQEENQYQKGKRPSGFTFPMARGKYIAFCEGDDYWIDESKISKQASFLDANPGVSLVYTDSISFIGGKYTGKDDGGSKSDLTPEELTRAPSISTLTACFRNLLDNPIELNFVWYGDIFIWSRLGHFGSGKYMQDILPSLYRIHGNGIHSLSTQEKKLSMQLQTYLAIGSYYARVGDAGLASYFSEKALVAAFETKGVSTRLIPPMKAITRLAKTAKLLMKTQ